MLAGILSTIGRGIGAAGGAIKKGFDPENMVDGEERNQRSVRDALLNAGVGFLQGAGTGGMGGGIGGALAGAAGSLISPRAGHDYRMAVMGMTPDQMMAMRRKRQMGQMVDSPMATPSFNPYGGGGSNGYA